MWKNTNTREVMPTPRDIPIAVVVLIYYMNETKRGWASHEDPDQTLCISSVWSVSSLCARRKLDTLVTHWAHSENSDQTGLMPRLIFVLTLNNVIM